jgi:hypothetical protein
MRNAKGTLAGLAAAALAVTIVALPLAVPADEPAAVDLTTWTPPDIATVKDDDLCKLIEYDHELTTETYKRIGPEVADPAMRYAGNNLSCQSCHLNAATQPYSMPWTGVYAVFPTYRAREGETDRGAEERRRAWRRQQGGEGAHREISCQPIATADATQPGHDRGREPDLALPQPGLCSRLREPLEGCCGSFLPSEGKWDHT